MYEYEGIVERVVDGDTVDCLLDLGFSTWKKIRVRLAGINAPESRTRDLEEKAKGLEAKKWLIDTIQENNNRVVVKSVGVGKYGRCLGIVHLPTMNINDKMVELGYAVPYDGKSTR